MNFRKLVFASSLLAVAMLGCSGDDSAAVPLPDAGPTPAGDAGTDASAGDAAAPTSDGGTTGDTGVAGDAGAGDAG